MTLFNTFKFIWRIFFFFYVSLVHFIWCVTQANIHRNIIQKTFVQKNHDALHRMYIIIMQNWDVNEFCVRTLVNELHFEQLLVVDIYLEIFCNLLCMRFIGIYVLMGKSHVWKYSISFLKMFYVTDAINNCTVLFPSAIQK